MSGEQITLFEMEGASAPAPLPESPALETRTVTVEVFGGTCPYTFKGCACQYEGPATSCDKLSVTCEALGSIQRLKEGPATNKELAGIALNYRARISDLRAAGYVIELADYKDATGAALYELRRRA